MLPNVIYKGLPNIVYRTIHDSVAENDWTSYVDDIDSVPFMDQSLYPIDPQYLSMIGSRGCPMNCTYCASGDFTRLSNRDGSGRIRLRNIDLMIEDLKLAQCTQPRKNVFFWDDYFITSTRRMRDFIEKYKKEVDLPFLCIAFPNMINEEMAELLDYGGCKSVCVGFQTANNDYKFNVLQRREKKESVAEIINLLEKRDIKLRLDHILNLPGETREHIGESLWFYLDNKVPYLTVHFLNYYPESQITQYAHEKGFMSDEKYKLVMKNQIIGEQFFKGTILNEDISKEQVRYAILFKLMTLLPSKVVKSLFKRNIYKIFPTNKLVYYVVSVTAFLKIYGAKELIPTINIFFPFIKKFMSRISKIMKIIFPGSIKKP